MRDVMLTTEDNPHDPFTNYDAWNSFDIAAGYHTAELIARLVKTSPHLSQEDGEQQVENVIDEIIREHIGENYKKVEREI